jgi:putative glutamine amidotransferase
MYVHCEQDREERQNSMHRPVIGITSSQFIDSASHGVFPRHSVSKAYAEAVHEAGGTPIILPFFGDLAANMLDLIDGLILTGGADIDPARFGDDQLHPKTYDVLPDRDEAEIELTRGALSRDMPILGICRGIQVLNVAMGGTLYQDVPDQFSAEIMHRQQEESIPANEAGHSVTVESGSLLERIYGEGSIAVNSFHHQAVREVAPGLVATGTSDDGLIEAVESPERAFVLGVQWHPELMFARHERHLAPFAALVEAAAAAKATARV